MIETLALSLLAMTIFALSRFLWIKAYRKLRFFNRDEKLELSKNHTSTSNTDKPQFKPFKTVTQPVQTKKSKRVLPDIYFQVLLLKTLSLASDTTAISLPILHKVALVYNPESNTSSITSRLHRWKNGSSMDGPCVTWINSNQRSLTEHGRIILAEKQQFLKSPEKNSENNRYNPRSHR